MTGDAELLLRYARDRSEPDFTAFVQRHISLVYGSALRRTGGNEPWAQDIAQQVFTSAARRAAVLARHPQPTAWLYTATRNATLNLLRAERRRLRHETEAWIMNETTSSPDDTADWEHLRPVLDAALDELGARDREAVLLRFFEKRSYADMGRCLNVAENTARMRVERALEKLHVRLARSGITSTAAALGTVLASQAPAPVPGGLVASVAGAAMAAPGAGGLLAGIMTFMSTVKITTGAYGLALLLAASLAGNAFLFFNRPESPPAANPPSSAPRTAAVPAPTQTPLAALGKADPAALRDELRAAGANEATVRSILEGLLLRRYREEFSRQRAERHAAGWWRDPSRMIVTGESAGFDNNPRLLRDLVTIPLEQLLGPDPADLAEAETRYSFLPPDLREAFGRLDRNKVPGPVMIGDIAADVKDRGLREAERTASEADRQGLLAKLSPEQRAEYDMHYGTVGMSIARQLAPLNLAEEDFRKVYPLADAYVKNLATRPQERSEIDLRMAQSLVEAFGYDRGLDFIWATSTGYPTIVRVAADANLPANTAGRVQQLGNETAIQAATIHADPTLSLDQKKAALVELQRSAHGRLDALLPAAAQARLPDTALAWLNGLSQGTYQYVATVLPGQNGISITVPISLTSVPSAPNPFLRGLTRLGPANSINSAP